MYKHFLPKAVLLLLILFSFFSVTAQTTFAWSDRYNSNDNDTCVDISLDALQKIHVAGIGTINGSSKIVTRYYDAAGTIQWTRVANTTLPGKLMFLKRDTDFNTILICSTAISSYYLIKYNVQGVEQWRVNFADVPVGLYTEGNTKIYMGSQRTSGFLARCYNSGTGLINWSATDPNGISAAGFAVDRNSNVYIGGVDGPSVGAGHALRITKFSAATPIVWSSVISTGTGWDDVRYLNVDDAGNVYFAGMFQSISPYGNLYLSKLNASGTHQWSAFIGTAGGQNDVFNVRQIFFDAQQNPVAVGSVYVVTNNTPYGVAFVSRFDRTNGNNLYQNYPNSSISPLTDEGYSTSVTDQYGNLYIGGWRNSSVGSSTHCWSVTKVNMVTGVKAWNLFGSNNTAADKVNSLQVNSTGDLYLGNTELFTNTDMVLRKYSQANGGQ